MPFDYVTVDEVRTVYLKQLSTSDEPALGPICTAASRYVDSWCNRRFYTTTGDETFSLDVPWRHGQRQRTVPWSGFWYGYQTFDPNWDIVSVTTLELAESTVKATSGTFATISTGDYFLQPADRQDGWPAQYIQLTDEYSGTYNSSAPFMWFLPGFRNVRITGKRGWNSTTADSTNFPQELRVVTAEIAAYLWRSRESGFTGISGLSDVGAVIAPRALSRFGQEVLERYRRPTSR